MRTSSTPEWFDMNNYPTVINSKGAVLASSTGSGAGGEADQRQRCGEQSINKLVLLSASTSNTQQQQQQQHFLFT